MQSRPPHLSSQEKENEAKLLNPNPCSSSSPSPSSSATRLWKPAAQRNLRNQWSKYLSQKDRWISASSNGRSHATSLVNAYLSQRYMPEMDLGVLSEMPGIRYKACEKLALQQEQYQSKLLSCYRDMVDVVSHMKNVSASMRCFLKGSADSPLVQFGSHPEDSNDSGDGGGIPVFSYLSIPSFENLGQELLQMFVLELCLKRLLVIELLSISCKESLKGQTSRLSWSDELYLYEFDDLSSINLYSDKQCQPVAPRIVGWEFGNPTSGRTDHVPDREILQVYLTAWLVEVNIDWHRVDQIFALVGEEMHINLS
ncbi:hypothetical protein CKAN_00573000 [Cinnamomum micranthum f. kanehirae]|uniref:Uncharacterized protein n=1 Tax=Cinnamomum micranthum f. kanehirae TaxID=337451 RepID=A0A443NFF0_9MAGN|nr:hypothetical protein CKAN_00573000 [Cinnamomum micranthum f. kanehirae]